MPDLGLTWGVLPPDTFARVLVFSPHFDDAAMGAGHLLLAHPGATVCTVFAGEFNVAGLVDNATETLRQGLLLKFKPVNLDVLPLYIVLMGLFPPVLWMMLCQPNWTMLASIALWLAAQLPLGMLVGFYLRRATALSTMGAVEAAPVYAQRNPGWQEFLQGKAVSAAQLAL